MERRLEQALFLVASLVVAANCRSSGRDSGQLDRCRELGSGELRRPGLSVHLGSVVERDGSVRPGTVPSCGQDRRATAHFLSAHDALERAPADLRPVEVVVHVAPAWPSNAPPLGALEVHQPSASVLVAPGPAGKLTPSMWLHEFAHLLMRGDRPNGQPARALFGALEEGIADYYAAAVQGSPKLSAGGEAAMARDLSSPPRGVSAGWEALALPDRRFDEHRFGWDLATRFWSREPRAGALLEDLLHCVASTHFGAARSSPREVVRALLDACPERSSDQISEAIADWLPQQLHPGG